MPRDGDIPADQMTAAAKLLHLAEFMETLEPGLLDLRTVHCAWGWGETIGLFPRAAADGEDDSVWENEMASAEKGRSMILGLDDRRFRHCFGIGYQFRKLGRPYTPADVAHHLRETAAALES
jgi:hypothetical protein